VNAHTCIDRIGVGAQCICDDGYSGDGITYCDECGLTHAHPNVKIVGGKDAEKYSWPAIAYVQISYTTDLMIQGVALNAYTFTITCTGTLIDRSTVLTAGHCVLDTFQVGLNNTMYDFNVTANKYYPSQASMVTVYLGAFNLSEIETAPAQAFYAQSVIRHPDYDVETMQNDIAIIKLSESVTPNDHIQVACLPVLKVKVYPPVGSTVPAYISGWGDIYDNSTFPDTLQNAQISILNSSDCRRVSPSVPKNWNSQICAGLLAGGVDTCQGGLF
jgi:secreted trypsin-like serine protease